MEKLCASENANQVRERETVVSVQMFLFARTESFLSCHCSLRMWESIQELCAHKEAPMEKLCASTNANQVGHRQ